MPEEYTRKQLWELYLKLPEELKEAVTSIENTDLIYEIGKRNGIEEEKCVEITKYVGYTLFGVLPPEELQATLERELKLKKEVAKKVTQEINRFIFYPVKTSLEELYKIEIAPLVARSLEEVPSTEIRPEVKPEEVRRDIYREPIE